MPSTNTTPMNPGGGPCIGVMQGVKICLIGNTCLLLCLLQFQKTRMAVGQDLLSLRMENSLLFILVFLIMSRSTDGVNFIKEGKVLDALSGVKDFRDPKVWRQDDKWFII